jgi:hypothetical protein
MLVADDRERSGRKLPGQEESMRRAMVATVSRRDWLSRMLAVGASLVVGVRLTPEVGASKKGKNTIASVKDRIQGQRDLCALGGGGGGTLEVRRATGGKKWFTYCEGGEHDGTSCSNTATGTSCKCEHTGKKGVCSQAVVAGGGAEPPPGGNSRTDDIAVNPGDGANPG